MPGKERFLVTAALPYANGPVHVGQAIGAYIPADVYVRYRRLRGDDVVYICGTDEHGTPITVSAEKEGKTPKQVVDGYHDIQLKAFNSIGVSFDNFSGTARKQHHELSQRFFLVMLKKGFIREETVERPFCPNCNRFLPDRYVKGVCPNCDSEDERGDQCEACGTQLEPHELKGAYCVICGNTPEMRETKHWFFELDRLSGELEEWINSGRCSQWPANARNFALGWIREGLKGRAITRDLSWGVPVPEKDLDGKPIEGAEGKVLYVWFDAPIGYISSTREWAEAKGDKELWREYWSRKAWEDGSLKIVHFIGKDNIPFHTIIWPAMLIAEGSFALPWQVASNEFLNLEGKKVSTSRGRVIWLHDITREFNPDAVRYYLLSIAPETNDSDFKLDEFKDKVNNELIATLGNYVNRTLTFIENKNGGVVPEQSGTPNTDDEALKEEIKNMPSFVGEELERFHQKSALARLLSKAATGNQYFQKKEPWKNEPATTLYLCANLCRSLAILMHPFLPFSSEKLWRMLGLKGSVAEQSWESAGELGLKPGHRIGRVAPLFEKIEDDEIEEFRKKYLLLGEKKKEEKMTEVDYESFIRMDLRVGEIKSAQDHPNADKLYVLKVDLGELGERTLVAGMKVSYAKEELAGKKIVVAANLAPVKIRGVESQGMLLAANVSGKPVLLAPEKDAPAGAKVT